MKLRFIIPFVICIVMMISYTSSVSGSGSLLNPNVLSPSSASDKQLQRLDEMASSLYEAAITNNRQSLFQLVQQLEKATNNDMKKTSGNSDGWLSMNEDLKTIENMLINGASGSSGLVEAARIRLAVDALVRPDHALWLQYEKVMLDDLSRVEKAWKRQTDDGAIAARAVMINLEKHAKRIEPAYLMMNGSNREVELLERIQYTNRLIEASEKTNKRDIRIDRSLKVMEEVITRLFERNQMDTNVSAVSVVPIVNPLRWTLLLGAFISAILTYTGWRKYKANPFGVKPLS